MYNRGGQISKCTVNNERDKERSYTESKWGMLE